mmetsp:Transcript_4442/g.11534  ORF Transcript_4442/g.11534 Transcript_4442/m.11534 type:complete len:193 (-) Transcript_4442:22-600(-)
MSDFVACRWPEGLDPMDESVAHWFDTLNDPDLLNLSTVLDIERESTVESSCPVISYSHFLPRQDLIPEKCMLYEKALPKAVGSDFLMRRVADLKPDIHVFGHTHFSWDCVLDGVRYIQWPLAYPQERKRRSNGGEGWAPFAIYDSSRGGMAQRRPTYWCNYYQTNDRAMPKPKCVAASDDEAGQCDTEAVVK